MLTTDQASPCWLASPLFGLSMQAFAVARIASGKLVMRHRFPRLLAKDYAQKATFGSPRRRPAWVSNAVSACEAAPLAVQTIDAKTARRRPLYAVLVEGAGNASDRVGARDRREPGLADEVLIVALRCRSEKIPPPSCSPPCPVHEKGGLESLVKARLQHCTSAFFPFSIGLST